MMKRKRHTDAHEASAVEQRVPADDETSAPASTREHILDIALDLFTRKGYAETSMREIAAELGFSKAALYYHFEGKQDILFELHKRFHHLLALVQTPLPAMTDAPDAWVRFVEELVGITLNNRKLIELNFRNREVMVELHQGAMLERHEEIPPHLQIHLSDLFTDRTMPLTQRVRRIASLAALGGVLLSADAFTDTPDAELEAVLRDVIHDVLGQPTR